MVSQRSGLWLDEETTRTQAEKPLIRGPEGGRKREGETSDYAQMVANAIAVARVVCPDWIFNQQPPETPFNAQRVFTNRLDGRTFRVIIAPPAEETCDIGQCGTVNWLYFKAHGFLEATRR
jgi:hypothetical protein